MGGFITHKCTLFFFYFKSGVGGRGGTHLTKPMIKLNPFYVTYFLLPTPLILLSIVSLFKPNVGEGGAALGQVFLGDIHGGHVIGRDGLGNLLCLLVGLLEEPSEEGDHGHMVCQLDGADPEREVCLVPERDEDGVRHA